MKNRITVNRNDYWYPSESKDFVLRLSADLKSTGLPEDKNSWFDDLKQCLAGDFHEHSQENAIARGRGETQSRPHCGVSLDDELELSFGDSQGLNARCLVSYSNKRKFISGSFRFSDRFECPFHKRSPPIDLAANYQISPPVDRSTSKFVFSPDAAADVVLSQLGLIQMNDPLKPAVLQPLSFAKKKKIVADGHPDGLIVIAGATGTGKSAYARAIVLRWLIRIAMSEYFSLPKKKRPKYDPPHLVTFEDPIEGWKIQKWTSNRGKATEHDLNSSDESDLRAGIRLTCRAKNHDVTSIDRAHLEALRQKPRVVYIGECREKRDWELALELGATGHLVVTTCHSSTLVDTFMKLAGDGNRSAQSRQQLASTLKGVLHLRTGEFIPPPGSSFTPIQTHFHLWKNTPESVSNFVMDGLSSIVSDGHNVMSRKSLASKIIDLQSTGCFDSKLDKHTYLDLKPAILTSAFQLDVQGI